MLEHLAALDIFLLPPNECAEFKSYYFCMYINVYSFVDLLQACFCHHFSAAGSGIRCLNPTYESLIGSLFFFSAFIVCTTPDLFKLLNNLTDGYLKPFGQIEPDCKKLLPTLKTTEN